MKIFVKILPWALNEIHSGTPYARVTALAAEG
jgi:hypothetical protein